MRLNYLRSWRILGAWCPEEASQFETRFGRQHLTHRATHLTTIPFQKFARAENGLPIHVTSCRSSTFHRMADRYGKWYEKSPPVGGWTIGI